MMNHPKIDQAGKKALDVIGNVEITEITNYFIFK